MKFSACISGVCAGCNRNRELGFNGLCEDCQPRGAKITGQVFFRRSDEPSPNGDGKKLVMFVGVVAVPDDSIFDERQCVVVGTDHGDELLLTVQLPGVDLSEDPDCKGSKIGQLLCRPIWRV